MDKRLIIIFLFAIFLVLLGCKGKDFVGRTNPEVDRANSEDLSSGDKAPLSDSEESQTQPPAYGNYDCFDAWLAIPILPEDSEDSPTLSTMKKLYDGRTFSMDDFASLVPGVSTSADVQAITPYYLSSPYAVGNVYQYPGENGQYIYIVCAGTIQAIYQSDKNQFVGSIEFSAMMEDPSLRPEIGRWKQ